MLKRSNILPPSFQGMACGRYIQWLMQSRKSIITLVSVNCKPSVQTVSNAGRTVTRIFFKLELQLATLT